MTDREVTLKAGATVRYYGSGGWAVAVSVYGSLETCSTLTLDSRRNQADESVKYNLQDIANWWKDRAEHCLAKGNRNFASVKKRVCDCGEDQGWVVVELGRQKVIAY